MIIYTYAAVLKIYYYFVVAENFLYIYIFLSFTALSWGLRMFQKITSIYLRFLHPELIMMCRVFTYLHSAAGDNALGRIVAGEYFYRQ